MESNVQKMIEGISEIRKGLHGMLSGKFPLERHFISALLGRCDGLLELPPRNCDVGKADEQENRFREFCGKYEYAGLCGLDRFHYRCPAFHGSHKYCSLWWAQMPYAAEQKGEGDGSK